MAREIVHTGRKIQVAVDTEIDASGNTFKRDLIMHPGAVVILPILDVGRVVLLRNYRFAIGETLWEVPAGTLEPGESPLDAAHRELAEETGYHAEEWHSLGYMYASPGVLDEKLHLYIAQKLTSGPPSPESDEQLEPVIVPLSEAIRMCTSGEIRDAKTITLLLLWEKMLEAVQPVSTLKSSG